jgi:hypothetical protein
VFHSGNLGLAVAESGGKRGCAYRGRRRLNAADTGGGMHMKCYARIHRGGLKFYLYILSGMEANACKGYWVGNRGLQHLLISPRVWVRLGFSYKQKMCHLYLTNIIG